MSIFTDIENLIKTNPNATIDDAISNNIFWKYGAHIIINIDIHNQYMVSKDEDKLVLVNLYKSNNLPRLDISEASNYKLQEVYDLLKKNE